MRYLSIALLLFILATACEKTQAPCTPPPPSISFRLMNSNNEDMLVKQVIKPSDISVKDEGLKPIDYTIQGDDTIKIIRVAVGANEGNHTYKLVAGDKSVDFSMNVIDGDCGYYSNGEKIIHPSTYTKDSRGFYVFKF